MAARKLVDTQVQPLVCDAPLKFNRKEPIVVAGDHANRNLWPCFKPAWLTKDDVGLGALMRRALLDDLGWNVMQEVGGKIEFRTVPTALCSFSARHNRTGVVPPLACRLARK